MAIKEILQAIAGKLTEEQSELKAQIAGAIREVDTLNDDLRAANAESKSRKEKIRELQAEIETKGDFTEKEKAYKAQIDELTKHKAELDAIRAKEIDTLKNTWKEKAALFNLPETDKRRAKIDAVKDQFVFADEGKELDPDTIKSNLKLFTVLEKSIGVDTTTNAAGETPPKTGNPEKPKYRNSGEAIAAKLGIK